MTIDQLITAMVNNGIGLVCAAAVLVFAFYRETKTIPQMTATFSSSLSKFSETVETMQKGFSERNSETMRTFATLAREERATCQQWHEENRQRLEDLANGQKENRHNIRDIANQLGLRAAVEQEKRRQQGQKGGPPT